MAALGYVRFTPESRHVQCTHLCLLWAKSGHSVIHSITASAIESTLAGMVRPSALAVLRLIASWYLVGVCTGRSAGFSPLRMRSTYSAARRYWSIRSGPYETRPPLVTKTGSE